MVATESNTVVDYAIEALREAIRTGALAGGQRLVVADICAMLDVSAGPVREAIRRLTGEGLVEIVPHRGASVRSLSSSDVREIFGVRQAIEGFAAASAAKNIDRQEWRRDLAEVMAAMKRFARAKDTDGYLENNGQFHNLIYRMADNARLESLATQLIFPLYQLRLPHRMNPSEIEASYGYHQRIAAAINAGDAPAAELAMRDHIAHSADELEKTIEAQAARHPRRRPRAA